MTSADDDLRSIEIEQRRNGIVLSPMAEGRHGLALALAWRASLSIIDAQLALAAAPTGMDTPAAFAWAGRLISPPSDSIGATHGH